MRTGMIALALGLLCLRWLPALPSVGVWVALILLGLCCLPSRAYPLGCFLLGFCWACVSAQGALDDRLSPELDGRTLWGGGASGWLA